MIMVGMGADRKLEERSKTKLVSNRWLHVREILIGRWTKAKYEKNKRISNCVANCEAKVRSIGGREGEGAMGEMGASRWDAGKEGENGEGCL